MGCDLLRTFFADRGDDMSWNICLKEYDKKGFLVALIPHKCVRIKMKWRMIDSFLSSCPRGNVREAQISRAGKYYPSIVSDGQTRHFAEPIVAKLPLFEYAKRLSFVA